MPQFTLEQFLREDYSSTTVKIYLYHISHFLKVNPKAKRYKYQDILVYMDEVRKKRYSTQYRVVVLSAIKKYYDYLVMAGVRDSHPCKKLNIKAKVHQDIQVQDLFSAEELQLLLTRENRYQYIDNRNAVLLSLLIYQGLTSEEITRLQLKDVDLDNGTIHAKGSANLNSRTLELVTRQIIVFSRYINETRPSLLSCDTDKLIITKLGKPIAIDSIHAIIEPLKPLFPERKLNPKTIRMSVICNWLNDKKLPLEHVQMLAGHKWPGTTEKYIKVDANAERELINKYFPNIYSIP